MLLKDRKWLNTGGEMSFVNQNQFPCILLFFRWAQGSVIVYWEGGDRSREYLRIIWFFGRAEGGDQKCCIPGCGFWLNAYLRTSFRFCVSGMTPMSRFYSPNVVGKGQQVKMQRRGSVFKPNVVLTFYTFCSHLLFSFYKGLLCRNTWLIVSYALLQRRISLSRLTDIIHVIVYFVFSFSYLKKFYVFETSRLSGLRGCLYFLLDNMVVTAQSTRQGYVVHAQMFDRCVCCSTLVWVQHNFEPKSVNLSADRPLSNNQNGYFFCCTIIGVSITYL